jgi:acyl carrier protein
VWVDKLSLTPNGKIDRNALPIPAYEQMKDAHDLVAPRTETEKAVARIWTELLGVDAIGIHDDFFDVGGGSLLAVRAVSRIREVFRVDIGITTLFDHPTIAGLADVLNVAKCLENSDLSSLLPGVTEVIVTTGNLQGLLPDQDFYDAGITDVTALPILLELEERYQVSIPDDRFMAARSPRAVADMILDLRNSRRAAAKKLTTRAHEMAEPSGAKDAANV